MPQKKACRGVKSNKPLSDAVTSSTKNGEKGKNNNLPNTYFTA
jgi:hypothetical protein